MARFYYYRARYYDSQTSRFVSQDPHGYRSGLNGYRYVRNNPLTFVDPSGYCEVIARIRLWSTEEVTIEKPRSQWILFGTRQEGADAFAPVNIVQCEWARQYDATIATTKTYLVVEECGPTGRKCPLGSGAGPQYTLQNRIEKERSLRTTVITKKIRTGDFVVAGFDSEELEIMYCDKMRPWW